ncbi:sigma-70 family RNA polymerase sigma factor [uncultured Roseibium sp.]|uniref:sigma-70 family RNA polymerase sigma factor n=1 Tax=uncultured Roseibium sp. TaxID=1936171 RepID=UPI00260503BD|nr:sigma-70 family RNA polymerase sigma factor [uncultured Roseibium sp.]
MSLQSAHPNTGYGGVMYDRDAFERSLAVLRPKIHRYCTRMIGSALEAEDLVQDALSKAYASWPEEGVRNPEAWLLRISHNRALDFLRARAKHGFDALEDHHIVSGDIEPLDAVSDASLALSVLMHLTPLQRSVVLLKDVFGYSLAECAVILEQSTGAVKSALHRARQNLKGLDRNHVEEMPSTLADKEASLLRKYVSLFMSRDFVAVKDLLLEDVRLDLVAKVKKRGKSEVSHYFANYADMHDLDLTAGCVEGRSAIKVTDASGGDYLIILTWKSNGVASIQDFHFARYVLQNSVFQALT